MPGLNENTPVPLKTVWFTAAVMVAGTLLAASVKHDMITLKREMFSRSEMKDFARDLAIDNRDLKVPKIVQRFPEEKESESASAVLFPLPELSANMQ